MWTTRRRNLLAGIPLLLMFPFIGLIGSVELLIWLGGLSTWIILFVYWGRRQ